jgi:hypothetical protein
MENNNLFKELKESCEIWRQIIREKNENNSIARKQLEVCKNSTLMLLLGFSLTISDVIASILSSKGISSKLKNKFFDFSDKDLIKWVIVGGIFLYFSSICAYEKFTNRSKSVQSNLQDQSKSEDKPPDTLLLNADSPKHCYLNSPST